MFEISSELNADSLYGLYEDDFSQMEIVFEATAGQLTTEVEQAKRRYEEADPIALKKVVHKMKPLFGYVGLDKIIPLFATFEEKCLSASGIAELKEDFLNLISITEDASQKIEKELERLKQFNTQYL